MVARTPTWSRARVRGAEAELSADHVATALPGRDRVDTRRPSPRGNSPTTISESHVTIRTGIAATSPIPSVAVIAEGRPLSRLPCEAAMPLWNLLFVRPDDKPLAARVRLAHYLELVRAQLHLAVNNGASIPDCVALATEHVPFWRPAEIGDALSDRGTDPLLRSYLWAYPAGIDWFVALADDATADLAQTITLDSTVDGARRMVHGSVHQLLRDGSRHARSAACDGQCYLRS